MVGELFLISKFLGNCMTFAEYRAIIRKNRQRAGRNLNKIMYQKSSEIYLFINQRFFHILLCMQVVQIVNAFYFNFDYSISFINSRLQRSNDN